MVRGWIGKAEITLACGIAIAIWFANGDPTIVIVASLIAALLAALGLFKDISNKRKAAGWFGVVVIVLVVESAFIIVHARSPIETRPSKPYAGSPEPVPTPPPTNPQPTPAPISPEDAAIQLGVWESVASDNDDVVRAYNSLDLALVKWESKVDTATGRVELARNVRDATTNLASVSQVLEQIRKTYPQLEDLVAALSNPPAEGVRKAASTFADAVTQNGSESDDDRAVRLRRLLGALRLQMGAMDNWMTDLGRTAGLRVRDLSGVK